MDEWKPIDTAPIDVPFLILMEKPVLHSRIQVAIFKKNYKLIANQFAFDFADNKMLAWMPLPKIPKT